MSNLMSKRILHAITVLTLAGAVAFPGAGLAQKAEPKAAPATPATVEKPKVETPAAESLANRAFLKVAPTDLVKTPQNYMGKDVTFEGTFNRFSDIALDYKKALRESKEYVSVLVLRPGQAATEVRASSH